jgi:hypothetical protein
MFAGLVLLSALLIEGIGTFISILGLAALFSSNPIILMMAVALDVGKVVAVSFVYKFWKEINLLLKTYMLTAITVLMIITSTGVFGFLSAEFQKAISGTNEQAVLISLLTEEKTRLQTRKEEIDTQIARLPENFVRGRTTLMRQFEPELNQINNRLVEIDKELPQLKVESIKKNVEVGPIIYIAEAFDTTPEKAVKWVILIIIFVFDPLAISLLIAGNFLLNKKKDNQPSIKSNSYHEEIDKPAEHKKVESPPEIQPIVEPEKEIISVEEPTSEPTPIEPPTEKIDAPEEIDDKDEIKVSQNKSKSSLEEIDATRIDVQFGDDGMRNFRNLNSIYSVK